MDLNDKFKVITQNGCIKEISVSNTSFDNVLNASDKVESVSVCSNPSEYIVSLTNGNIQKYDVTKNQCLSLFSIKPPKGIQPVFISKWTDKYFACFSDGNVEFYSEDGKPQAHISCGTHFAFSLLSLSQGGRLVTGGNENDFRVWNLESLFSQGKLDDDCRQDNKPTPGPPLFAAKNVPQTKIKLRKPVWPKTMMFIPDCGDNLVLLGTAYGEIRLYDTRGPQRRPTKELVWDSLATDIHYALTCFSPSPSNPTQEFFAGNAAGKIGEFDLRFFRSSRCQYRGPGGGVVELACPKTEPRALYSLSWDGFLRIFDRETRDEAFRLFLISKPLKLSLSPETRAFEFLDQKGVKRVKKRIIEDPELDAVWNDLEPASKKTTRLQV